MSVSRSMTTRVSAGTVIVPPDEPAQKLNSLLQVQGSGHFLERQAKLNHRKCDVRLDPDDDRVGASKLHRVCDAADCPRRERVEDVERRQIDDDATSPEPPHPLGKVVS